MKACGVRGGGEPGIGAPIMTSLELEQRRLCTTDVPLASPDAATENVLTGAVHEDGLAAHMPAIGTRSPLAMRPEILEQERHDVIT